MGISIKKYKHLALMIFQQNLDLYAAFTIDLTKVFHTLSRVGLWRMLSIVYKVSIHFRKASFFDKQSLIRQVVANLITSS